MLRFQYLTITHPEAELVALLRKMKGAKRGTFLYQKTLATEYARNLFKSEDYVGCFKTRRTSLSESSVWVVITGDELRVTNITPSAIASLGITEYNLILNAFYALSALNRPKELVKAVFELRVCLIAGFAPQLDVCPVCGSSDPDGFNVSQGSVQCLNCSGLEGIRLRRFF